MAFVNTKATRDRVYHSGFQAANTSVSVLDKSSINEKLQVVHTIEMYVCLLTIFGFRWKENCVE